MSRTTWLVVTICGLAAFIVGGGVALLDDGTGTSSVSNAPAVTVASPHPPWSHLLLLPSTLPFPPRMKTRVTIMGTVGRARRMAMTRRNMRGTARPKATEATKATRIDGTSVAGIEQLPGIRHNA